MASGLGLTHSLGQWIARNLVLQHALNGSQCWAVLLIDKGNGTSFATSASRSSNSVYIVFGVARAVVVNDHRDVVNVNTARHNIGGHEYIHATCLEVQHNALTIRLFEVGVHRLGV